jgi:hypothetical protein
VTAQTLLDEFRASMAADEEEALRCQTCGARGYDACDLHRHPGTSPSWAAYVSRFFRLQAMRRAAP